MDWMLPWFLFLGIFSTAAILSLMATGGVPAVLQVMLVGLLLTLTGLCLHANRASKEAPDVERIR
jgi:hypothetical protein